MAEQAIPSTDLFRSFDENPMVFKRNLDAKLYLKLRQKSAIFAAIMRSTGNPTPNAFTTERYIEWMRGVLENQTIVIGAGGVDNTVGTVHFPVKNQGARNLRPGFIVRSLGGEAHQVMSIDPDENGYTVYSDPSGNGNRCYGKSGIVGGGTGAWTYSQQTFAEDAVLQILPALPEGSQPGVGSWTQEETAYNITQIIDQNLDMSDTALKAAYYGVENGKWQQEWNAKTEIAAEQLANIFINGVGQAPAGPTMYGTMTGIVEYLTQYSLHFKPDGTFVGPGVVSAPTAYTRDDLIANGRLIHAETPFSYAMVSNKVDDLIQDGVDPSNLYLIGRTSVLRKGWDWIVNAQGGTVSAGNIAAGNAAKLDWSAFNKFGAAAPRQIETKSGHVINMMAELDKYWPTDVATGHDQLALIDLSLVETQAMKDRAWKVYIDPPGTGRADKQSARMLGEWTIKLKGVGDKHVFWENVT